jgi:hypothetical protein
MGGCSVVEQSPPFPGFEGSNPTDSILYRDGCNFFAETVQLTDGQQKERWQQKLFFLKYFFCVCSIPVNRFVPKSLLL